MELTFEQRIPVIQNEINKRRAKYTLSTLDFEDVSQIIMFRVWEKYHLYKPERGEFTHWLNMTISNTMKNILRDNLTTFSRPCILGCSANMGDENCSYTKSGKQCSECPIYKRWEKKKKDHFNVKQTLTIENHTQEVSNMASDFLDIDYAKRVIDEKIKGKLNTFEFSIYEMLFIQNMSEEQVGEKLKYKRPTNSSCPGYQTISKLKKKFTAIGREIIREENLG